MSNKIFHKTMLALGERDKRNAERITELEQQLAAAQTEAQEQDRAFREVLGIYDPETPTLDELREVVTRLAQLQGIEAEAREWQRVATEQAQLHADDTSRLEAEARELWEKLGRVVDELRAALSASEPGESKIVQESA